MAKQSRDRSRGSDLGVGVRTSNEADPQGRDGRNRKERVAGKHYARATQVKSAITGKK